MFDIREILGSNTPLVKVVAVGASWTGGDERFYTLLDQRLATLVGFEPNNEEYIKLQQLADDRNKTLGFECYKYLPYAIGDGKLRAFHILQDSYNSSILVPNYAIHHYIETVPNEFAIRNVETVQTIRLDDIQDITDIDYLHLDTQGFELNILEGLRKKLKQIVVLHTEVCFIDLYQNQPLFGDVDIYLRQNGFYFHHLERISGRTCLPFSFGELGTYSQQAWADFVYVPAYDRIYSLPSQKLLALAVIAHAAYNHWDLAGHALLVHDRVFGTDYAPKYKERVLAAIKPREPEVSLSVEDKKRAELSAFINDVIHNNRVEQYLEATGRLAEFADLLDVSDPNHQYAWVSCLAVSIVNLFYKCSVAKNEVVYDRLLEVYRSVRKRSAQFIIKLDDESLVNLFASFLEPLVDSLSLCQRNYRFPLEEDEEGAVKKMTQRCNQMLENSQQSGVMQLLLALRLYKMPHQLEIPFHRFNLTGCFLNYYVCTYLNYSFIFSTYPKEYEEYYNLIEARLNIFTNCLDENKADWVAILPKFISNFYYFNLYLSAKASTNLRSNISKLVMRLLQLSNPSTNLDHTFTTIGDRNRYRVGILVNNTGGADINAGLPYIQNLDDDRFQTYLYSFAIHDAMPQVAHLHRLLPADLNEAVSLIRSDDLDLLIIGTNITFNFGYLTSTLSHYRLARVQIATPLCPITTGIANVDYFLSGTYSEANSEPEAYTEKLVTVDGSGLCFSSLFAETSTSLQSFSRADFGIPIGATVYTSGANPVKSSPEVCRAWITILKNCPNSYLLIYPFYSGWILLEGLKISYKRYFLELARLHGIEDNRVIVLQDRFPSRNDLVSFLGSITDVYLDSFPFTGAFSILDPLDAGVPVVTLKGKYLRQAQAGALLQEIDLEELVTRSVEDYISLAVRLGTDNSLRESYRQKIRTAMLAPPFRNTKLFAQKLSNVYLQLVEEWRQKRKDVG
ncbi:MAG: FkbM family methyltransferase [Pseudanabaenaceae cyanobacterium SKYGB_i_bin29]|nr:FkbM family methyltransferase [Pseudanabaenaceae cyanobacterium SKYG29]MDW8421061.1 FkbM family methyltransferase [Pseudanabaenaceae cyanobacterium SKYGB_i_bin29]